MYINISGAISTNTISYKSNIDRNNIFDVPSYSKLISALKGIDDKPWIKPALAILMGTGCRVKELLYLKRGHVKFLDYQEREIPNDTLILNDVSMIQFNLHTEKNRKNKHRIVPLIKNEVFLDLVDIIVEYAREFKYDDSLLFPYSRGAVWYAIKRNLGKDFFPHFIRHANVTNDTRSGVSPVIQKTKYGWTDLRPHSVYSHLNFHDVLNEQKKVYGEARPLAEIITDNIEFRKEYNKDREYKAIPINESKPIKEEKEKNDKYTEQDAKEDKLLTIIADKLKELPEHNSGAIIESIPITDDNEPAPYPKKEYIPLLGPALDESSDDKSVKFAEVKPEGAKYFREGDIVKDKVVIVTKNDTELNAVKDKYSPRNVLPVNKPDPVMIERMKKLRNLRSFGKEQYSVKSDVPNSEHFLDVV